MTGERSAIAGLAVIVVSLGIYLFYQADIRMMPEMDMNVIMVELTPVDMTQDQILNALLIPVEKKILKLNNVTSVKSNARHQKGIIEIRKETRGNGSLIAAELKDILDQTGVSYAIEPLTDASFPVFHYIIYSPEFPDSVNTAAAQFTQDLEKVIGIRKIKRNEGLNNLKGLNAFKRYNGYPAVSLTVFVEKDCNIRKTVHECEELKERYEKEYYLEIASVGDDYGKTEKRVHALNMFILISAVTAAGIGGIIIGSRALFAALSMLFCYELSILLLDLTGISLNLISVIGILIFSGYSLSIAVIAMAYTKTGITGESSVFILPLILSAAGYCVIFLSGLLLTGTTGDFLSDFFLASAFMILVSLAYCLITIRQYPSSGTLKNRRHLSGVKEFLHLLIDHHLARILVVFIAVMITIIPIVKWKAVGRFLFFPELDQYSLCIRIDAGNGSEVIRALSRIERQLHDMAEIESIITDYGVIYPYSRLAERKSGENVAQVVANLKSESDHDKIKTIFESQSQSDGVHLDIRVTSSVMPPELSFKSYIYCDTYATLKEFSNAYRNTLERVDGVSNIHSTMDGDGISRRDGRFYNVIGADIDESVTTRKDVIAGLKSRAFPTASCDVQYEDPAENKGRQEFSSSLLKMSGISLFGLLMVLILIIVTHRSALGLLIPFSMLFIFAGIVTLTKDFSFPNIFTVFGIQSIWTLKLLIFLRSFNLNRTTDISERIIACMEKSFSTALMIYIPLVAGSIYLWINGDFFIKAIALSFIGGMIYLMFFDLIFLPVAKKVEYKIFG